MSALVALLSARRPLDPPALVSRRSTACVHPQLLVARDEDDLRDPLVLEPNHEDLPARQDRPVAPGERADLSAVEGRVAVLLPHDAADRRAGHLDDVAVRQRDRGTLALTPSERAGRNDEHTQSRYEHDQSAAVWAAAVGVAAAHRHLGCRWRRHEWSLRRYRCRTRSRFSRSSAAAAASKALSAARMLTTRRRSICPLTAAGRATRPAAADDRLRVRAASDAVCRGSDRWPEPPLPRMRSTTRPAPSKTSPVAPATLCTAAPAAHGMSRTGPNASCRVVLQFTRSGSAKPTPPRPEARPAAKMLRSVMTRTRPSRVPSRCGSIVGSNGGGSNAPPTAEAAAPRLWPAAATSPIGTTLPSVPRPGVAAEKASANAADAAAETSATAAPVAATCGATDAMPWDAAPAACTTGAVTGAV